MKTDYFDSPDFQQLLSLYEYSRKTAQSKYFDEEEIADLSDYYVENGKTRQASDVLSIGLRLHPGSIGLRLMHAGVKLCDHKYEEAKSLIDSVSAEDNVLNDYYYVSAQLRCALDNDWEGADKLFTEWIEKENGEIDSDPSAFDNADELKRDNYLHILSSIREFVADVPLMRRALSKWVGAYIDCFRENGLGNCDIDLAVGEICADENLTECCETLYTLMLENNPYLDDAWTLLAAAQYTNGKYLEAIESAEFALAIDPNDCNALLAKAHSYYSLNMFEDAVAAFRKFCDVLERLVE